MNDVPFISELKKFAKENKGDEALRVALNFIEGLLTPADPKLTLSQVDYLKKRLLRSKGLDYDQLIGDIIGVIANFVYINKNCRTQIR
jgi:SET domain-containing protein